MPGPNSNPTGGKTQRTLHKVGNQVANQRSCQIRQGGGKHKGTCGCPKHPSK